MRAGIFHKKKERDNFFDMALEKNDERLKPNRVSMFLCPRRDEPFAMHGRFGLMGLIDLLLLEP
jgi:hypothetical protein